MEYSPFIQPYCCSEAHCTRTTPNFVIVLTPDPIFSHLNFTVSTSDTEIARDLKLTYVLLSSTTNFISFVNGRCVLRLRGPSAGITMHDFKITCENEWRYYKIWEISETI